MYYYVRCSACFVSLLAGQRGIMMFLATEAIFRMKLRGRHEIRFDALSRLHSLLVGKIPGNWHEGKHAPPQRCALLSCQSLLTRPRRPDLARPQHDQTTPNDNPICCTQKGASSHRDIVIAQGIPYTPVLTGRHLITLPIELNVILKRLGVVWCGKSIM